MKVTHRQLALLHHWAPMGSALLYISSLSVTCFVCAYGHGCSHPSPFFSSFFLSLLPQLLGFTACLPWYCSSNSIKIILKIKKPKPKPTNIKKTKRNQPPIKTKLKKKVLNDFDSHSMRKHYSFGEKRREKFLSLSVRGLTAR